MGRRVRTLTRRIDRPNPFGDRVSVVPYRFDDPDELTRSLRGAAVLHNTYWVRFPHGRVTFAEAIANTRILIRACEAAGVGRMVHLSVTGASEDSPLPYFRGKGILERAIRESKLSYAILRPALIYGPGDILVNNIAWFLRHLPACSCRPARRSAGGASPTGFWSTARPWGGRTRRSWAGTIPEPRDAAPLCRMAPP